MKYKTTNYEKSNALSLKKFINKLKSHFSLIVSNSNSSPTPISHFPNPKPQTPTPNPQKAFTIVELLVVIVVIGILAAITIVSYTGINNQAIVASIKSDLATSSKLLKLFQVDNGNYPTTVSTNCDAQPDTTTNKCIKLSPNNIVEEYTRPTSQTFSLVIRNGTNIYEITDNTTPLSIIPVPITAIGSTTGTAEEESILTAGALTPPEATPTASYQWQVSDTLNGTYTNIASNSTSSTFTLTATEVTKYVRVTVTGTIHFPGTVSSVGVGPIAVSPWVTVGTQIWARANLNVGTRIAGTSSQTNNAVLEKYCYSNNEANCTTYGALYQWNEAMQYITTEGAQGICPAGSHIPSDNDWKILEVHLGMTQAQADATNWRGTDQGTKLKSGDPPGLNIPLAGYRYGGGSNYNYLSSLAYLWSSSESGASARDRLLNSGYATVFRYAGVKGFGFSVRCLNN